MINSAEAKLAAHYQGAQASDRMFTAVSNMMRDTHQTNMIITNNMGGGGWRYNYSWH